MKRRDLRICYSYEHGDESLPLLKDLVSDEPDPEKAVIINYLRTNCVLGCPGICYDEITPGKVIGAGNIFSDGTYFWDDVFTNYVDRYNIPVPETFREHILKNNSQRMKRHLLLRLVDRIEIENNPYLGYRYNVRIQRNGTIEYSNNIDRNSSAITFIKPEDAAYIIDPIMTELFCYDADNHGTPIMDGYHWKISFQKGDDLIDVIEGWTGEDNWRYSEVKSVVAFVERYVPFDLGFSFMTSV